MYSGQRKGCGAAKIGLSQHLGEFSSITEHTAFNRSICGELLSSATTLAKYAACVNSSDAADGVQKMRSAQSARETRDHFLWASSEVTFYFTWVSEGDETSGH